MCNLPCDIVRENMKNPIKLVKCKSKLALLSIVFGALILHQRASWLVGQEKDCEGYHGRTDSESNAEEHDSDRISLAVRSPMNNTKTKTTAAKLVLLIGYMRGGTSLMHEIFNHDRNCVAWYEPLSSLYGHLYGLPKHRIHTSIIFEDIRQTTLRNISRWEVDHLLKFFRSMFSCDITSLPSETLSDTFIGHVTAFKDYNACFNERVSVEKYSSDHACLEESSVSNFCAVESSARPSSVVNSIANNCDKFLEITRTIPPIKLSSVSPQDVSAMLSNATNVSISAEEARAFLEHRICMNEINKYVNKCSILSKVADTCKKARIIFAKVLRLKLKFIEPVLKEHPELKIIHFVRNPLAVVSSRTHASNASGFVAWTRMCKKICSEIKSDLESAEEYQKHFQDNFFRLRYEDIVLYPHKMIETLYEWIGEPTTPGLQDWLMSTMYATHDGNEFDVKRTNASAHVDKWRHSIPENILKEVTESKECKIVLQTLGYSN